MNDRNGAGGVLPYMPDDLDRADLDIERIREINATRDSIPTHTFTFGDNNGETSVGAEIQKHYSLDFRPVLGLKVRKRILGNRFRVGVNYDKKNESKGKNLLSFQVCGCN